MIQNNTIVGKLSSFLVSVLVLCYLFTLGAGKVRAEDKTFPGVWKAKSESINGKSVEASKAPFKFRKDGTGIWSGKDITWKYDEKEEELTITAKTFIGDSTTKWLVKWMENGKEVRLKLTAFGQAAEVVLVRDN